MSKKTKKRKQEKRRQKEKKREQEKARIDGFVSRHKVLRSLLAVKRKYENSRVYSFIYRHKVLLSLLAVIGLSLLLRFLHLLNSDHYYILGPDSYYFNWVSKHYLLSETSTRLVNGNPYIPSMGHTGLSYPLGWLSIALSSISGLSRAEALTWAGKLLPPLLGVIMALLIYWMGSRMYNRTVGIFAALSWVVLSAAIIMTSAGYLDRDALSLLLITAGILVFYLSKDWSLSIGKLKLGWILGGLLVVAIEALLYLEWALIGPLLLLAILAAYFTAVFLVILFARLYAIVKNTIANTGFLSSLISSAKLIQTNTLAALRETNWRAFALILFLNFLALFIIQDFALTKLFDYIGELFDPEIGFQTTEELQGMTLSNLHMYIYLSIPLLIGLYHTLKNRRSSDILWLTWFLLFFILGFFAKRTFVIYAVVPGCMISGLGLGIIYNHQRSQSHQKLIKIAVQLLLVGVILISLFFSLRDAYQQGSGRLVAPQNDWYESLIYLKEETPEDAIIMTWWDYGYWILDIAERTPVVDNGYRPEAVLQDIAQVYCTDQDSEAIEVMRKYNASYLVISMYEADILWTIASYGPGYPYSVKQLTEESLFARFLGEDLQSANRFGKVVIISLTQ